MSLLLLLLCFVSACFRSDALRQLKHEDNSTCDAYLGTEDKLPTATYGGLCGKSYARFPKSQCCSQYGVCGKSFEHCGATCQCELSGKKSKCNGQLIPDSSLPTAAPGSLCGISNARCPGKECCSVFGICTANATICSIGVCSKAASGEGSPCDGETPMSHTRQYTFMLKWGLAAPDGFERQVILVNKMFPGPQIDVNVGDRIVVKVVNNLGEPVSIHWHGMVQRNSVNMDGAAGVTQNPIQPGTMQIYSFLADHAGNYWYHSHYKTQYMDGLRGGIVVRPVPDNPFNLIARPPPFLVSDWYHERAASLITKYLSDKDDQLFEGSEPGDEPVPTRVIVDAFGQGECIGLTCNYTVVKADTSGDCEHPTTVLSFINGAGFAKFYLSVDEHYMRIASQDAVTYRPSDILPLVIASPGQRVGVALCPATPEAASKAAAGGSFWLRASIIQSVLPIPSPSPLALAIVQYGDDMGPIMRELPNSTSWAESVELEEVEEVLNLFGTPAYPAQPLGLPTPPPATKNFTFIIELTQIDDKGTSWAFFNNISMQMDQTNSVLNQSLTNTLDPNDTFGRHVVEVEEGDVVQFIFQNRDGGYHPLHFHGHWMWVMARGMEDDGDYVDQPFAEHPILRDTMDVLENSYLVVRFMADNLGTWILHCHIDWHLEDGLAMVVSYGV